jgi:hypothetical protein
VAEGEAEMLREYEVIEEASWFGATGLDEEPRENYLIIFDGSMVSQYSTKTD